tara:strand:- start:104 stop:475 length:372 start_codon:yes stop_codon:yes gene_type:complete
VLSGTHKYAFEYVVFLKYTLNLVEFTRQSVHNVYNEIRQFYLNNIHDHKVNVYKCGPFFETQRMFKRRIEKCLLEAVRIHSKQVRIVVQVQCLQKDTTGEHHQITKVGQQHPQSVEQDNGQQL